MQETRQVHRTWLHTGRKLNYFDGPSPHFIFVSCLELGIEGAEGPKRLLHLGFPWVVTVPAPDDTRFVPRETTWHSLANPRLTRTTGVCSLRGGHEVSTAFSGGSAKPSHWETHGDNLPSGERVYVIDTFSILACLGDETKVASLGRRQHWRPEIGACVLLRLFHPPSADPDPRVYISKAAGTDARGCLLRKERSPELWRSKTVLVQSGI